MSELKLKNERETLMKVAEALKSMKRFEGRDPDDKTGMYLNMQVSARAFSCGTVACIGGHAWLIENPNDFDGAMAFVHGVGCFDDLWELFYGRTSTFVTPDEAVQAINNYLSGKKHTAWDFLPEVELERREEEERE